MVRKSAETGVREAGMSETLLFLIRHGATPANELRPYILQGKGIDLPLSPNGERQVAEVAAFLKSQPLRHVYCSPLVRARQTAEAIAAPHQLPIQLLPGIIECHVGLFEGLDWGTIHERHPQEAANFLDDPATHPYLDGESYADVYRRVAPVFDELLRKHRGEAIAVVAHNIVNRVYLAGAMGLELRLARDLKQHNACVNLITHSDLGTHVVTMNSAFHLTQAPA